MFDWWRGGVEWRHFKVPTEALDTAAPEFWFMALSNPKSVIVTARKDTVA